MKRAIFLIVSVCFPLDPAAASGYDDFGAAVELGNQGQLAGALSHFDSAIAAGDLPASLLAAAYHARAGIHQFRNELDEALADDSKAIELDPDLREATLGRAETYRRMSNLEAAKQDCDTLLAVIPNSVVVHRERSSILEAMKDYSNSLADAQAVLKEGGDPNGLYRMGYLSFHLGRFDDAQSYFSRQFTANPRDPFVWLWLATVRMKMGQSLPGYMDKLPSTGWPMPLVDYLQGKISKDEVINKASHDNTPNTSPACDIAVFMGGWAAIRNDQQSAAALARYPAQNCSKTNIAWAASGFLPDGK